MKKEQKEQSGTSPQSGTVSNGMKVLYLFTNSRSENAEHVKKGEDHDNHFFGMFRLGNYGVEADFLELENKFSKRVANFLRRHVLNMHFVHVPLIPFMRSYDVVLTSAAYGTLLLWRIFHFPPRKWVMFDYNLSGMLENTNTFKQRVFKWMIGGVSGFITLSKEEAEAMRARYPEKAENIIFLPFACDTEYYKPVEGLKEKDFILSVGRDPGRDLKTLCEAVKGTGTVCKVTAKEQQFDAVKDVPKEVERYSFSKEELLEQYTKAKVVVLPLNPKYPNDSMGCSSLVEALAMGKAVVATDTVTMRNYITDGINGRLVPQGDVDALKKAVTKLLDDEEKRKQLGKNARAFVRKECNPGDFVLKLKAYLLGIEK